MDHTPPAAREPRIGMHLNAADGRRIGVVDAVFADYLLVRTASLLPIDLYVPRPEVTTDGEELRVAASRADAYRRWHRPLKRAPHD